MNQKQAVSLVEEMVALGICFRLDSARDVALKARVWHEALRDEGVAYAEASAAAKALSRRHGEDRIINAQPGDVIEEVFAARVAARSGERTLPAPPCEACHGSGFEIVEVNGVERARRCSCRSRSAEAAA